MELIESTITMVTLDMQKFKEKIGACGPMGIYRGLYEFSQNELNFFDEELFQLQSSCHRLFNKVDEKEKLADEKHREIKKQNSRIKDIRPVNKKDDYAGLQQFGSIVYPFLTGDSS